MNQVPNNDSLPKSNSLMLVGVAAFRSNMGIPNKVQRSWTIEGEVPCRNVGTCISPVTYPAVRDKWWSSHSLDERRRPPFIMFPKQRSLPASQRGGGNRRGNALFSCGYWWPIKHSWNAGLWSDESSKHRFYPLPTITHHSIWPRWCDKILTMLGQLRGVLSVDRRQGILKASTWALRRGDEVWRSPTSLKLANSFSVVVAGQTSLQLHPFLRIMHWRYLTFDMDLTDNSLGMKIKHSWGVTHWWMVMCESLLPFSWCVYCTVHPGERNGRIDEYPWHGNPTSGETNQASAWKRQHWRVEGSESGSSVSFQLKLGVFRWDVHSATEHEGLLVRY